MEPRSLWVPVTPTPLSRQFPFFLEGVGKFYTKREYFTERAGRADYLLIYTVEGKGRLYTDGGDVELLPGTAVLFDCCPYHCYYPCRDGGGWNFLWLHLNGLGVPPYHNRINEEGIAAIRLTHAEEFERDFHALLQLGKGQDLRSLLQVTDRLCRLLTAVAESRFDQQSNRHLNPHREEIERVLLYMEQNCQLSLTLEQLAERAHLSKYYFSSLFAKAVGLSPYEYLLHCRVSKAKLLLRNTSLSVGEIAQETGFSDQSNFIRKFKRIASMTPGQYRKEQL